MVITGVEIENYRSHASTKTSLGRFSAIVGENNAGKSTFARAVKWAIDGGQLVERDYYDETKSITVVLRLSDIKDEDLARISNDENRRRISEYVVGGSLSLQRVARLGEKGSSLQVETTRPRDPRLHDEKINELLKGKTGKAIGTELAAHLPEYASQIGSPASQSAAKKILEELIANFPFDQRELSFRPLPTGLPEGLEKLLPEVVLIEAVKDARDEVKTDGQATFGKILGLLMSTIDSSPQMTQIRKSLFELERLLNIDENSESGRHDGRLDQVKIVESLVREFLSDGFPVGDVELVIPIPKLKQLFTSARFVIDDGIRSEVETKGDGLKRALIFALLRTYVELPKRLSRLQHNEDSKEPTRPYLFLFEEPELYLHPSAQVTLVETLRILSADHQVVVTTHSPLFLQPAAVGNFLKFIKKPGGGGKAPFTDIKTVELEADLSRKDLFQMVHFENNSAGFFAKKVVLVEGDSDVIYFERIGNILGGRWSFRAQGIPVIAMNSKSGLGRFCNFFEAFGVEPHAVLDLDAVLEGVPALFDIVGYKEARDLLLHELDSIADARSIQADFNGSKVRDWIGKRSWKDRYLRAKEILNALSINQSVPSAESIEEFDALFSEVSANRLKRALLHDPLAVQALRPLLNLLRNSRVHILVKGSVEEYYPEGAEGSDKPSRAMHAARLISTELDLRSLFPMVPVEDEPKHEHEVVFSSICGPRGLSFTSV